MKRLQAGIRIDRTLENLLRIAGGDFFDFHAAFRTGHYNRQPNSSIHDHSEINLAGDIGRLLHEDFGYSLALLAGLLLKHSAKVVDHSQAVSLLRQAADQGMIHNFGGML